MIKSQIGKDAGRIWRYLDEHGESTIQELLQGLELNSRELDMALGWLARENKIFFYGENDHDQIILIY